MSSTAGRQRGALRPSARNANTSLVGRSIVTVRFADGIARMVERCNSMRFRHRARDRRGVLVSAGCSPPRAEDERRTSESGPEGDEAVDELRREMGQPREQDEIEETIEPGPEDAAPDDVEQQDFAT